MKVKELIEIHQEVKYAALAINPAVKYYDKFCKMYDGVKTVIKNFIQIEDTSINAYVYQIKKGVF